MNNMYEDAKTWSPFKGCKFDCVYCRPSFQRQAKRQKHLCEKCYRYEPHFHPERLKRFPGSKLVFACGNGDIHFATKEQKELILNAIRKRPKKIFLLQSKAPNTFHGLDIPDNCYIGTTIETNRNHNLTKAPQPIKRYKAMCELNSNIKKYVTVEPILDFDLDILVNWIREIEPAFMYIGYANHITLDSEPSENKTLQFKKELERFTEVRRKTLRKAWWAEV